VDFLDDRLLRKSQGHQADIHAYVDDAAFLAEQEIMVRRVNLWVIDDPLLGRLHLDGVVRLGRWLVGISAPVGTTNCASATRLAVKPCAGACPRAA
jgi:hypothetical protein